MWYILQKLFVICNSNVTGLPVLLFVNSANHPQSSLVIICHGSSSLCLGRHFRDHLVLYLFPGHLPSAPFRTDG